MMLPVHPSMASGRWWACEHPERPYDEQANYHNRCRACWLSAKASSLNGFAEVVGRRSKQRTLAEWVDQYAPFHGVAS